MNLLAATVTPQWLLLREPADHRARSSDLVDRLTPLLPAGEVVVHDLGSGTGSMTRWLAPQLAADQHWVLHDLDDTLLALAASTPVLLPGANSVLRIGTHHGDVTRISPAELADATLVTTSALLDLLTADEVNAIAHACVRSGKPALLTLSVTGRVRLTPAHALDPAIEAAFNAHQRRTVGGRRLLGPDAVVRASAAFQELGAEIFVAASPWRLGPDDAELIEEWLTGWVAAACEQQPELAEASGPYLRQRLAEARAGRLRVTVGHADLLAVPGRGMGRTAAASATCSPQRGVTRG